jgi:D-aminoacyl-tRNA deacylase
MRAVVQRVERAQVKVGAEVVGRIGAGILVLLGVSGADTETDADYLLEKILNLRIFVDEAGKMNRSLIDSGGELLIVSQFTLYGDCRRGRRPSYTEAAAPELAEKLYEYFVAEARRGTVKTETGIFQAMMAVELVNDGPVTLLLDSRKHF